MTSSSRKLTPEQLANLLEETAPAPEAEAPQAPVRPTETTRPPVRETTSPRETTRPATQTPTSAPVQPTERETTPTRQSSVPLRSPADIDLPKFNALVGDWAGKPVEDMKRLFVKQVVLDGATTLDVETVKVPGYIGISDALQVTNPQGKKVSGHEDIAKFLDRDGLYICTYQWHKERYGVPLDTRQALAPDLFTEAFIKNEGHHSGAIVPAQRIDSAGKLIDSFGTFNEPDDYHRGMYGKDGYVAVAQKLTFPEFVTAKQARGYTDTIICWMALLNPFTKFPSDYNGGDPTRMADRATLKEFLKNGLLAALGDAGAIAFFKKTENMTYCAEYMFIALNTPLYPFNKKGLTDVLDGDAEKAEQILAMRDQHNKKLPTVLSKQTGNPEFKAFNIRMPLVPEGLPALDKLMTEQGQSVDANRLPFPPFKISDVIRHAFRTLLPRHQHSNDQKLIAAQARMFSFMEPALLQQLGLSSAPADDPKVVGVRQFVQLVSKELSRSFNSYAEFDQVVDGLMAQADEMLVGAGDRVRFVPPRIYVDLGQNDGDTNLPQGWGFRLETVGALVARGVIKG